jgi:hypothetical protein
MTTQRTEVVLSAQDRASEVLRRLSGTVDGMQRSFDSLGAPIARFQGLWASLVGGAVVAGIRSLVGSIDDLDEAAQGLGTTAVELSNLRAAAGEAGVGAEALDTALTRLNVNLSNAATGSKEQAALFRALGVSIRDSAGSVRPTIEVLRELADRFAELEEGPAKAALAVDVFGKTGARLLPYLNEGGKGLQKFSGLTQDAVDANRKLQGEFDRLTASVERYKNSLAGGIAPELNKLLAGVERAAENVRAVDWSSGREAGGFFADLWKNSPAAQFARELPLAEQRQRAIAEGLKLSGAEAVQARLTAQAVRDKAAADQVAEGAVKRKARATEESGNAYAKEFADVERIRRNRERLRQDIEDEETAAADRRRQRLEDLTGRSTGRQFAEDLNLVVERFNAGKLSVEEYETAMRALFGENSEIERGMTRQGDLAEQLGLTMASSLGELITAGDRAGNVWKALGQDIAKLTTQLLVIKPLAAELTKLFSTSGGGGGGGGSSLFGDIFKSIGGAVSGFFTGGGAGGASGAAAGAAGGQVFITNYIDGAVDRARISSYVENGVRAGLAQSWDNVARGGSGVLAG